MFKKSLEALSYPHANAFQVTCSESFRQLIIWLEENKVQSTSNDAKESLKKSSGEDWNNAFNVYKQNLGCPPLSSREEELNWILGHAIQLETSRSHSANLKDGVKKIQISTNVSTENPLDNLDFSSREFSDGVIELAKVLKIKPHPNVQITLHAIRKLVSSQLNANTIADFQVPKVQGVAFPINQEDATFDLKNVVLNQGAQLLRLLYIHEMRELQTTANELIVAVQNITADPKTDTSLGKVGR